ncbi:B-cadherin-like [Acipenser ruthenus]|uniref:B-cadherin-like n=1 Tax=Acipenser ruthenus TaxID=7906 RepID=UPI0015605BF1|nr:B-cadherin-like [Acipenser ruthenus]
MSFQLVFLLFLFLHEVYPETQRSNELHVVTFPSSSAAGLRRQKRDWVLPPLSVSENEQGPFPKAVAWIKSTRAKAITVYYSITGPGADAPPEGLFTITKIGGGLYVTQPLDRESQAQYIVMSHAVDINGRTIEDPMELIIKVTDQNDNRPEFTMNTFLGNISEGSAVGAVVMKVTATDKDDPTMDNGVIGYSILNQEPKEPHSPMFSINKFGTISLVANGLDREAVAEYKLIIQAADMDGKGLSTTATAIITVTDQNDQAPQFKTAQETVSLPENEVGVLVMKLAVTDLDVPHTPAWNAKYTIVRGNTGNVFNITTEPSSNDGILRTAKGLDYETTRQYTLFVTVENEEPFTSILPTATATITVNVEDVSEAPIFNPLVKSVVVEENLPIGSTVAVYTAIDPDKEMKQTVTYRMGNDPAGWLEINNNGVIKAKQPMDRESIFVKDDTYTAMFLALDNASPPATGTGTLVVELTDVNDNSPEIVEREVRFCNKETVPQILNVVDRDTPIYAGPFKVQVLRDEEKNWTATMNDKGEHIILTMAKELKHNGYLLLLRVFDTDNKYQDISIKVMVCNCKGDEFSLYAQCPY